MSVQCKRKTVIYKKTSPTQEGEHPRQGSSNVAYEALACSCAPALHKCHLIPHKGANKEFRMYQMLLSEGCLAAGLRQKKQAIRYIFSSLSTGIWSSFQQ